MSNVKLEFSRGEVIAEKYEVVDHLDESPLGVTYRVKHLKTNKYVRLVLLRPRVGSRENKDEVLAAHKRARSLHHPNLIKLGELGENEGVPFYTQEDFEGSTLRELLQEYKVGGKQFAVKEAAQITTQILDALTAAHAAGIVMRALRPEHVLVNVRYTGPRKQNFVAQVKLTGLGFWDLVPAAVIAEDEFTRGEAQYLAPEFKSFDPSPSPRCDIYSAGVIFYEMLVGSAPVGTFQLPRAKRPDLPEHINNVVELALAHAPEDRYQTTTDFSNDIQRTFQDAGLEDDGPKRPLVTPLGWGLAAVLVLFISVIAFNFRPDVKRENAARDSQIRKEVLEAHAKPTPGEVMAILEKHPKNMVYVPSGPFVSGRLSSESLELARPSEPVADVVELDAYLIDIFEFPNLANDAPRYNVSYSEAEGICAEQGKRLCTEMEWEKACKGPRNLIYSYGDTFDVGFCGTGIDHIYLSGQMEGCKSGWGVYDMSGNFREWTATPPSGKDNRRIVKGGLKGHSPKGTRCASATDESVGFKDSSISFRCCRDVDAPQAASN